MNAQRTLREIAGEIEADWRVINNQAARKALDYMKTMGAIEAPFAVDPDGYAVCHQQAHACRDELRDVALQQAVFETWKHRGR